MKQHQKTIGKNDEWLTPKEIISALGEFDLDPASPINRPYDTAKTHLTTKDDGLNTEWRGRVFLNPPFNRYNKEKWMSKMADHNNGIMLIPASCETDNFYKYVWGKASGVLMLKGRPHFHYIDGSKARANSGCTICLIAYGVKNLQSLIDSKLGIVLTELILPEADVFFCPDCGREWDTSKCDTCECGAIIYRIKK